MKPVLIVGPGAIGGVLAARWAKSRPVLLLGRNGLNEVRECEAAFFCVKSGDTRAAVKAAAPWVGPGTAVVGLQNGLAHAPLLRRAFADRTVLGTCFIAADRTAPRTAVHTGGNEIWLAEGPRNWKAVLTAKALLEEGGWKVSVKSDEDRMLWTKLVFNAAVNPLGAACNATNGQLTEDPSLRRMLLDLLAEAESAAKKAGHKPYYPNMRSILLRACAALPKQRNSMLQDIQAGRKTECSAILGPLLGPKTPLLNAFSRIIRRLEAR